MEQDVELTGGRITTGVVKRGDKVLRPMCANSPFVHEVLRHLEKKVVPGVPRYHGVSWDVKEILDYIPGDSPENLGMYTDGQLEEAVLLIKSVHTALLDFAGCRGNTVCHNDLSPCNFVFSEGHPVGIIDWDAAAVGGALDDLAYAVWMWLDIGNEEITPETVGGRMKRMLDVYGVSAAGRFGFVRRIAGQMERVAGGVYPSKEQAAATKIWADGCRRLLLGKEELIQCIISGGPSRTNA